MDLDAMDITSVIKFMFEYLLPTAKLNREGLAFLEAKVAAADNRSSEGFLLTERAEVMAKRASYLDDEVTRIGEFIIQYAKHAKAEYLEQKQNNKNLIEVAQAWKRWQVVGDFLKSRVSNAELAVAHATEMAVVAKDLRGPVRGGAAKEEAKQQTQEAQLVLEELARHSAIVEEARALVRAFI